MEKVIKFFEGVPITKLCSSILMIFLACMMTTNVITRYVFNFSFAWGDEIVRYACVYMSFLGIICGFNRGQHIGITIVSEHLIPEKARPFFRLVADFIAIAFMAILFVFAIQLIGKVQATGQTSAALQLPMYLVYAIVPVCSILSIIQILIKIYRKDYMNPRE